MSSARSIGRARTLRDPSDKGGGFGDGFASTKAARNCGFNEVNLDLKESDMGIELRGHEEKGC